MRYFGGEAIEARLRFFGLQDLVRRTPRMEETGRRPAEEQRGDLRMQ